jgi:hypothetical protein
MSKKTRDYIFWIFSIIFLFGTIAVSLYASGYQLNLGWPPRLNRLLLKTGMVAAATEPRGATIYLNGVAQKTVALNPWNHDYLSTPAKLKNLTPGEYELRLELNGYWPVTKKINVYSGQTTFAEDINLFRSNLPYLISSTATTSLKLSPSDHYLLLNSLAAVINLRNNDKQYLATASSTSSVWLTNEDKLLTNGQIFDPNTSSTINYQELIGPQAKNWYYANNENRLYYQATSSLSYFDLTNNRSSVIVSGDNYEAYQPAGSNIFLVTTSHNQTKLQKYSLTNNKVKQEIYLPPTGHYIFKGLTEQYLSLYDDHNHTLYLINPNNLSSSAKILNQVLTWQWIDTSHLFYNNKWEIYLVDLKHDTQSLLVRLSENLKEIIYNKSGNYLIYSSSSGLNAYDLQIGLSTKLFTSENLSSLALDQKNNTLYFWAKIGQQAGVYKFLLQ